MNLAKYYKNKNRDLANLYFDKAIEICDEIKEPAVYVIQLAIEAEKLSISKNINEDKFNIIKKYKEIMKKEEFMDIHKFLNKFENEFEYIEITDNILEIQSICKSIASEIKI